MPIAEERLYEILNTAAPEKAVNYLHCLSSEEAGIDDINLAVVDMGSPESTIEDLVAFALSEKANNNSYEWQEKLQAYAVAKGVSAKITPIAVDLSDPQTRIRSANSSVFKEQFAEVRQQFLEEMKAKDQAVLDAAMKAFTGSLQSAHGDGLDEKIPEILNRLKVRYKLSPAEIQNNIADVQAYLTEISKDARKILPQNAEDAQILLGKIVAAPNDDRVAAWNQPDNYGLVKPYLAYAWKALDDKNNLRNKDGAPVNQEELQNNLKETMMQQFALLQNAYALEGLRYKGESTSCAKGTCNAIIETLDGYHSDITVSRSFEGGSPTMTLGLAQAELSNFFLQSLAENVNVDKRKEILGLWDKDSSILLQPKLTADLRQISSEAFSNAETQLLAKYKTSNNKYYSEIRPAIAQNLALPTRDLLKPEVDVLYEYKRMLAKSTDDYAVMGTLTNNGGIAELAPELKTWLDEKEIKSNITNNDTLAIALKTIKREELTSLTDNILNREYTAFKAEFDQKTPTEQLDILFDQEKVVFAGKGLAFQASMSKRFNDSVNIPYGAEIDALWDNPEYQTKIAAAIFDGSIARTEHLSLERASEAYTINNVALNSQLAEVKTLKPSQKKAQDLKNLTDKLENQDKVMGAAYEERFEKDVEAKNYDQLFAPNSNEDLEKIRQTALKHVISSNKPVLIEAIRGPHDVKVKVREVVEKLLEGGADVNAKDKDGNTALMFAAGHGHTDIALALIDKGADVNAKNKDGISPLMFAAVHGHTDIALALIDKGADITKDNSPLMLAAQVGSTDVAKLLIDKGADVNAKDAYGVTALMRAALDGQTDITLALIDNGADVNAQDKFGRSPLMFAAEDGSTDVAKLLIDNGADVNVQDEDGGSPLMSAAGNGHTDVAKLLIDNGADVNAQDKFGRSPLIFAANNGHTDVTLALIENGADVNAKNKDGRSPLMLAAKNGNTEVFQALLAKGADIDAKDKDGKSAIDLTENPELKSMLLEAQKTQAATKIQSVARGRASRLKTAQGLADEIAQASIDKGADVNAKDAYGVTALMRAALDGQTEAAQVLIDQGADVNAKSAYGTTALIMAVDRGNMKMVSDLIKAGADVFAKNILSGESAMDLVNNEGIKSMLLEAQKTQAATKIQSVARGRASRLQNVLHSNEVSYVVNVLAKNNLPPPPATGPVTPPPPPPPRSPRGR